MDSPTTMFALASHLDAMGQYDLSDRLDGMVRTALTGRQLAELYALEAMGVPSDQETISQNIPADRQSFLIDTAEGRRTLLQHAEDLAENIQVTNDERIQDYVNYYIENADASTDEARDHVRPDPSTLAVNAIEFLEERMRESGLTGLLGLTMSDTYPEPYWTQSPQQKMDFSTHPNVIRTSQRVLPSWEEIDETPDAKLSMGRIEDAVNDFATSVGEELDNSDWTELIWQWWRIAKMRNRNDADATIRAFMDSLKVLVNDPGFQDDFWKYHWNDNWADYAEDYSEWLLENEDDIRTELYDPEDVHWQIDDALSDLHRKRYQAERSGRRADYLAVMAAIDKLSSMSHHGGPAFEYGDTTEDRLWRYPGEEGEPEREPNLVEVMNRKFGDRFLPWLLASGNFPEKYQEQFQRWYEENIEREGHEAYRRDLQGRHGGSAGVGRAIDREVSSEGYYRHPYYSQRDRWLAQHSPTYQTWTPFDSDLEDRANIQSVARSAYEADDGSPRRDTMRDFVNQHGGQQLGYSPDIVNRQQYRSRWQVADVATEMVRIASRLDGRGQYDLVDRLDGMVRTALKGRDLAKLYALQGLDTPTGGSQLVETDRGRSHLLRVAKDMLWRIRAQNQTHTSDAALEDHIRNMVGEMGNEWWDEKRNEMAENILYDARGGSYWYQDPSESEFLEKVFDDLHERLVEANLPGLKQSVAGLRNSIARSRRAIANGSSEDAERETRIIQNCIERIGKAEENISRLEGPNTMLQEYQEYLAETVDDPENADHEQLLRDYVVGILDSNLGTNVIADHEVEQNSRYWEDSWRSSEDVHFDIDEVLDELQSVIQWVEQLPEDDEAYDELMGIIDKIVDMSHHGGPLLEYSEQDDPKGGPLPSEIMHRKQAPGFTQYSVEQGFVPQWATQLAEQGQPEYAQEQYRRDIFPGTSRGFEQQFDRDDYYRHPRYQSPAGWQAQHQSPSTKELNFAPPGEARRRNTEEVLWGTAERRRGNGGDRWSLDNDRFYSSHNWAQGDLRRQWEERHGRPQPRSRWNTQHEWRPAFDPKKQPKTSLASRPDRHDAAGTRFIRGMRC